MFQRKLFFLIPAERKILTDIRGLIGFGDVRVGRAQEYSCWLWFVWKFSEFERFLKSNSVEIRILILKVGKFIKNFQKGGIFQKVFLTEFKDFFFVNFSFN